MPAGAVLRAQRQPRHPPSAAADAAPPLRAANRAADTEGSGELIARIWPEARERVPLQKIRL